MGLVRLASTAACSSGAALRPSCNAGTRMQAHKASQPSQPASRPAQQPCAHTLNGAQGSVRLMQHSACGRVGGRVSVLRKRRRQVQARRPLVLPLVGRCKQYLLLSSTGPPMVVRMAAKRRQLQSSKAGAAS